VDNTVPDFCHPLDHKPLPHEAARAATDTNHPAANPPYPGARAAAVIEGDPTTETKKRRCCGKKSIV